MTSYTSLNKRSFLNTARPFNGDSFKLLKVGFKILIQSIDLELWETIISSLFIPTHHINGEVADKPDFLDRRVKYKV